MAQAKNGDTVRVHYTGTLDDGTIFDSSEAVEEKVAVIAVLGVAVLQAVVSANRLNL